MIKHVFDNRRAILTDKDKLIEISEENIEVLNQQVGETYEAIFKFSSKLREIGINMIVSQNNQGLSIDFIKPIVKEQIH